MLEDSDDLYFGLWPPEYWLVRLSLPTHQPSFEFALARPPSPH